MPAPLVAAAAVPAAAKLGGLGLMGAKLKGALGALFGAKKAAAGTAAATTGKKGLFRMAGDAIKGDMTGGELAWRLAPDVILGGGLTALTTPGDMGDKLIAGSLAAAGGGLTGLASGRAAASLGASPGISQLVDMMGGVGGDMLAQQAQTPILATKDKLFGTGQGLDPWTRMQKEQQEQFAEQIRQQTLASAGLIPGYRGDLYSM